MKNEVHGLKTRFGQFGFFDLQKTCQICCELGIYEGEMWKIIDDYRKLSGYNSNEFIDPVYCMLDHVLHISRNHIKEKTGYDFVYDFSGLGAEINTYRNHMSRSYDCSEEAIDELKEKISLKQYGELIENKRCKYFFTEIGIGAE